MLNPKYNNFLKDIAALILSFLCIPLVLIVLLLLYELKISGLLW